MTYTERARALRPYIVKASASLSDEDALQAKELYDAWKAGIDVKVDERYRYNDKLYRVIQAHTTQEGWEPDATPAMWVVIDDVHSGTKDDPISASRGMEYEYGLYYSDAEDGKLYLCQRQGATVGDKIVLQYMPHELVGQYFTLVE